MHILLFCILLIFPFTAQASTIEPKVGGTVSLEGSFPFFKNVPENAIEALVFFTQAILTHETPPHIRNAAAQAVAQIVFTGNLTGQAYSPNRIYRFRQMVPHKAPQEIAIMESALLVIGALSSKDKDLKTSIQQQQADKKNNDYKEHSKNCKLLVDYGYHLMRDPQTKPKNDFDPLTQKFLFNGDYAATQTGEIYHNFDDLGSGLIRKVGSLFVGSQLITYHDKAFKATSLKLRNKILFVASDHTIPTSLINPKLVAEIKAADSLILERVPETFSRKPEDLLPMVLQYFPKDIVDKYRGDWSEYKAYDNLDEEGKKLIRKICDYYNMNNDTVNLDRLHPFFIAAILELLRYFQANLFGLETDMSMYFHAKGKELLGLETTESRTKTQNIVSGISSWIWEDPKNPNTQNIHRSITSIKDQIRTLRNAAAADL